MAEAIFWLATRDTVTQAPPTSAQLQRGGLVVGNPRLHNASAPTTTPHYARPPLRRRPPPPGLFRLTAFRVNTIQRIRLLQASGWVQSLEFAALFIAILYFATLLAPNSSHAIPPAAGDVTVPTTPVPATPPYTQSATPAWRLSTPVLTLSRVSWTTTSPAPTTGRAPSNSGS
jgi:hypothetical protein